MKHQRYILDVDVLQQSYTRKNIDIQSSMGQVIKNKYTNNFINSKLFLNDAVRHDNAWNKIHNFHVFYFTIMGTLILFRSKTKVQTTFIIIYLLFIKTG